MASQVFDRLLREAWDREAPTIQAAIAVGSDRPGGSTVDLMRFARVLTAAGQAFEVWTDRAAAAHEERLALQRRLEGRPRRRRWPFGAHGVEIVIAFLTGKKHS